MRLSILVVVGLLLVVAGWTLALIDPGTQLQPLLQEAGPTAPALAKVAAMPDRVILLGYVLFLGGLIRSGFGRLFQAY